MSPTSLCFYWVIEMKHAAGTSWYFSEKEKTHYLSSRKTPNPNPLYISSTHDAEQRKCDCFTLHFELFCLYRLFFFNLPSFKCSLLNHCCLSHLSSPVVIPHVLYVGVYSNLQSQHHSKHLSSQVKVPCYEEAGPCGFFFQHPSWLSVSVDDTRAPTSTLTCKCFNLHCDVLVQGRVTCRRFLWLTALHVVLLPSSVSAAPVAPAALAIVGYWYFEYCCCPVVLVCSDPFW